MSPKIKAVNPKYGNVSKIWSLAQLEKCLISLKKAFYYNGTYFAQMAYKST